MPIESDVVVKIDDAAVLEYLTKKEHVVGNLRSLLKKFQVLMIRSLDLNFRHEGRPNKWAPLKPATMKRKKSTGILKDTGRLRLSCTTQLARDNITKFTSDSLTMGSSAPYARYLQEGTKHMPARPFIVIQNEDIEEMERLVTEHLLEE